MFHAWEGHLEPYHVLCIPPLADVRFLLNCNRSKRKDIRPAAQPAQPGLHLRLDSCQPLRKICTESYGSRNAESLPRGYDAHFSMQLSEEGNRLVSQQTLLTVHPLQRLCSAVRSEEPHLHAHICSASQRGFSLLLNSLCSLCCSFSPSVLCCIRII